jgi:hypothetical protein
MKTIIETVIIGLALFIVGVGRAAEIDVTFDNVPAQIQCGQTWTNNNVILSFSETLPSEGSSGNYCSFEADSGYVWLYPSRLILDFSLLSQPVTAINANVVYDMSGLFAYNGMTNIGVDQYSGSGTLSLNFTNQYPSYCAIWGSEGIVSGVTISTGVTGNPPTLGIEQTNGVITVFWPTNQDSFVLESNSDLSNPSGWTTQTNNIQFDGTNFYYTIAVPVRTGYFRLRH